MADTGAGSEGHEVAAGAVLYPGTEEAFKGRMAAVRNGLKDEGLVEGRDYVFEVRFANGNYSLLPNLARELDALKPRVFVAAAFAVRAVQNLQTDVPLVFTAIAVDPVAAGLAQSYVRPGGIATGNVMNAVGGEESLTAKRLGLFQGFGAGHPASWHDRSCSLRRGAARESEEAALRKVTAQLGIGFESYEIKADLGDLEPVLSKDLGDGAGAFYISGDPLLFSNMSRVMPHILATGKPTLGVYPEWARAGLLLTYSTDAMDGFRRAGAYAAKIVRGAKPGDLPIEQASKFWLVVNLKAARQLGIKVSSDLLTLADEVIE